jgi:glutamyl-tRNA reductase
MSVLTDDKVLAPSINVSDHSATLVALGFSHHTTPLALREQLAFGGDQVSDALGSLRHWLGKSGASYSDAGHADGTRAAILSTCNRTELYVDAPLDLPRTEVKRLLAQWIATERKVDAQVFEPHALFMEREAAVRHAFRVASGLDSMVLGEPQILGQFKEAVRMAQAAHSLSPTLERLFHQTFSVAKLVRTETAIGEGAVSMAAACVKIAARIFETLSECSVLLVGAGEMNDLVGTHFAGHNVKRLVVMNRGAERGDALAQKLRATYAPLAELPNRLHEFDIVISCTASTLPLIGLGAAKRAISARKHRPMLMVDLAVPRDIEPEVAKLNDMFVYTVDDLQAWVREGIESRQAAVGRAEVIIEQGVADFMAWLSGRKNVGTVQAIHHQADAWRMAELERAQKMIAAGHDPQDALEQMSRRLSQKFLHGTLTSLSAAQGEEQTQLLASAERFFLRQTRRDQS